MVRRSRSDVRRVGEPSQEGFRAYVKAPSILRPLSRSFNHPVAFLITASPETASQRIDQPCRRSVETSAAAAGEVSIGLSSRACPPRSRSARAADAGSAAA